jgi:hypothetical protein
MRCATNFARLLLEEVRTAPTLRSTCVSHDRRLRALCVALLDDPSVVGSRRVGAPSRRQSAHARPLVSTGVSMTSVNGVSACAWLTLPLWYR